MPASDASWVLVGRYLGLIRSTVVKTGCNPAVREEVEEKCVLRLYQKVASFNFEEADPDTATPFAAYAKAIVPSYARSQASILGKRYSIVYPDIAPWEIWSVCFLGWDLRPLSPYCFRLRLSFLRSVPSYVSERSTMEP